MFLQKKNRLSSSSIRYPMQKKSLGKSCRFKLMDCVFFLIFLMEKESDKIM